MNLLADIFLIVFVFACGFFAGYEKGKTTMFMNLLDEIKSENIHNEKLKTNEQITKCLSQAVTKK